MNVPEPCREEVLKYLKYWDNLENYKLQEDALDKLFFLTVNNSVDYNHLKCT